MPKVQEKNIYPYYKIGVWHITESSNELINMLKINNINVGKMIDTKSEIRLKQWLAIRLLLNNFYPNTTIEYDKHGKPILSNGVEISISHAGVFAVIALNEKGKCGIDIEQCAEKVDRIKHKFLNQQELDFVETSINKINQLTTFWCAKEALYKMYGEKELIFNEQLFVETSMEKDTLKGTIKVGNKLTNHLLKVEKIDHYYLVYTM